jgi:hypothetical protein
MPRYVVERTFPDGSTSPIDSDGAQLLEGVVDRNAEDAVTWVGS